VHDANARLMEIIALGEQRAVAARIAVVQETGRPDSLQGPGLHSYSAWFPIQRRDNGHEDLTPQSSHSRTAAAGQERL